MDATTSLRKNVDYMRWACEVTRSSTPEIESE